MGTAKYQLRKRTDEQAKHWDDLQAEIDKKRTQLQNREEKDQLSPAYKDEICARVKELKLCPPEHYIKICQRVLRAFSDRF